MFGLNVHDLPRIYSYRTAETYWKSITPFRGAPDDAPRPMGYRASRNPKTVRRNPDGSIAFTYHCTDCVVWRPGDWVTINTWPSMSTARFISRFLPTGVDLLGECDTLCLHNANEDGTSSERFYVVQGPQLRGRWHHERRGVGRTGFFMDMDETRADQPAGTVPVEHWRVNRKHANEMYKVYHLQEFKQWALAFGRLQGWLDEGGYCLTPWWQLRYNDAPLGYMSHMEQMDALASDVRGDWPCVLGNLLRDASGMTAAMAALRKTVQHRHDCFDVERMPYVTTREQISKARASRGG